MTNVKGSIYRVGLLLLMAAPASCMPGPNPVPGGDGGNDDQGVVVGPGDMTVNPPYPAGGCGACVLNRCAKEVGICKADPGCAAWLACLDACAPGDGGEPEGGCEAACAIAFTTPSRTAVLAFQDCRYNGAGASCAGCVRVATTDGGSPLLHQGCPPSNMPTACGKCQTDNCCNTQRTLSITLEGQVLVNCLANTCGPTDAKCQYQCLLDHPKGVRVLAPHDACLNPYCGSGCGGETDCVQCEMDRCLDRWVDCEANPDCFRMTACIAQSATDADRLACRELYAAGLMLFESLHGCVQSHCGASCTDPL